MKNMQKLHQALNISKGTRQPERSIETHSKNQAEVLSAFVHYVDAGGLLQQIKP